MKKKHSQLNMQGKRLWAARSAAWLPLLRSGLLAITALAVTVAATVAWFANNQTVDSAGMSAQVKAGANLIIADNIASIQSGELAFQVSLDMSTPGGLTPARHQSSVDGAATSPVSLVYNKNPKLVPAELGTATGLTFAPVPVYSPGDPKQYYFDHTVYIASTVDELHAQELKARMQVTPKQGETEKEYFHAVSIDFYLLEAVGSESAYKGTLNAAGKEWTNSGSDAAYVNLNGEGGIDIPLNTSGFLTVLMRCYFDGGLLDTQNRAYVRSEGLSTYDFDLLVEFEAVE